MKVKEDTFEESQSASSKDPLARDLGAAEAVIADLELRLQEIEEREQQLVEQLTSAQEELASAAAAEQVFRIQLDRYARFHEAVLRSKAWKMIQSLRRLLGREW